MLSVCATRAVMPYEILMFFIVGLTPAVIVLTALASRMRTLPTARTRIALGVMIALSAIACGGSNESTTPTPTPPTAPFSSTDLREGTGTAATQGRTVTVSYTGWLFDPSKPESKGTQFDSQATFTFQLGVGRVIAGWEQGIPGMKTGGQRRLVIPPNLGYGAQMVG